MLHDTIAANPNGTAIVFGDRCFTYAELASRVAGFRRRLRHLNVGAGDHVLIVLPNCPEFVVGYFATAGLRATVEAVDPDSTEHELLRYVREGTPAVVVTNTSRAPLLERLFASVDTRPAVTVVGNAADGTGETSLAPSEPHRGAWVVAYSSGSTGEPKRVYRSQANQVAEADNIVSTAEITGDDVILCAVPLFHALGQFCCLIVAMRAGATLVLLDGDTQAGDRIGRVVDLVREHRVTIFPTVPYTFEALADTSADQTADFSSVRLCLSGSNFLSPTVGERFQARFGAPIRQTYGSTEAGSVSWDCTPGEVVPASVGRPLNGVQVEILGDEGRPLLPGTIGEIAVTSDAVMTGYSADGTSTGRRYRSGDLGWIDADGRLYLTGRTRILIDTGGHKVNPVEVEDVLQGHPAVASAAVVGVPLRGGGDLLVAAVIPRCEPDAAGLREYCRQRMAEHKVPRRFEFVGEIPRTAVGKVRRTRLAAMLGAGEAADAWRLDELLSGQPPAARIPITTEHLVRTVAGILGVQPESVDPTARLRSVGLDSLGALRLKMAVQNDLHRSVGLPYLLGEATIATLAADTGDDAVAPLFTQGDPTADSPLSYNQLSIWHDDQLATGSARYNQTFAARIISDCDVDALRRTFQTLVDRHPMLRTTFRVRNGVPSQFVAERSIVDFEVVEAPPGWDEAASDSLSEEACRPFELESESPLRVRLYTGPARGPILLVTVHHLATDYWALVTMLQEIAMFYTAEASGAEVYRPSPPYSYLDYAKWLAEQVEGPTGQRDWAYWQERLRELPPALELPVDTPRSAVAQRQRATLFCDLDPASVESLRSFARTSDTTVYTVLLATFYLLLHAYTAERDLAVAVITTNRQRDEFREVLGHFVNPIISRVRIAEDRSFGDLVEHTRQALLEGMEHQLLPIEVLMDRIGVVRDRSRAPLVEVAFGQNKAQETDLLALSRFLSGGEGRRLRLGGLALESVALPRHGASYDFSGAVYESDEAVTIAWEYNNDLFAESTVRQMAEAFETLVRRACANPDRPIGGLDAMGAQDRRRLLEASRGTAAPDPHAGVSEMVAEQVAGQPEAIAVDTGSESLTYRELDHRAARLAALLRARGTVHGARVALWLEPSVELAVAGFAALLAGAVADAIDGDATLDQVAAMLADDDVRLLITTVAGRSRLGDPGIPIVCVDVDDPAPREVRPVAAVAPDAPAVVLRTSGVSGPARAVVLTHRALTRYAISTGERYGPLGEVLVHGGLAVDRALIQVLAIVAGGGTALLTAAGSTPEELCGLLCSDRRLTLAMLTPTELALVLPRLDRAVAAPRSLTLVVTGESLPGHLVREWRRRTGLARVVHEYGCAEAALTVSAYEIPPDVRADTLVPAGRPVPGVERYVIDDSSRLCPVGVRGQICVATADLPHPLGAGFQDERFTPNPFPGGESVLLQTGDAGCYLGSGDVLVLGRVEQRVSVRGYHVDLGQVETALARLPSVTHAVVVRGEDRDRTLVARIAMHGEGHTKASVQAALRHVLPHYMIPAEIVFADEPPRARNGKTAHIGLSSPATADFQPGSDARQEELTPMEAVLATIWQEILGVDRVRADDDYFVDLGGDSVRSLQIVSRAADAGVRISPRQIFTYSTVRELAAVAEATKSAPSHVEPHRTAVPLTPIQRWFFEQNLIDVHHWNQAVLLRARRPVDRALLRTALSAVADHHVAFRLRYTRTETGWEQTVVPEAEAIRMLEHELVAGSPVPEDLVAVTQASLNLTAGPVCIAAILSNGTGEGVSLLLVAHHLVVDFVSWRIVFDDLARAYEQLESGTEVRLPPVATPFPCWAELLTGQADAPEMRGQLDYWAGPAQSCPTFDKSWQRHARRVSAQLSQADTATMLGKPTSREAARPHEIVLAAVAWAVLAWTGELGVRIDVEGHGRGGLGEDTDLTRTVGWLTSVHPLHFEFDPALGPAQVLATVLDTVRNIPGRGLGYGLLRYSASEPAARERLAALPPAMVNFNYLGHLGYLLDGGERTQADRAPFIPMPLPDGHDRGPDNVRPYPLEVSAMVSSGGLSLSVVYSHQELARRDVDQLVARILDCLRAMIDESPELPEARLVRQGLSTSAEDPPIDDLAAHILEELGRPPRPQRLPGP